MSLRVQVIIIIILFFIHFSVFILPPAEGAKAKQAPVFYLKQSKAVWGWII